ncbi:hypothetical protein [Nocardiopsis alborubida]|uniref:hypothetical protein n=1 Tax=Nocardiopsis alborubida TaxID=146802 RepID=UPI000A8EA960|nr:hypothetical protein [Nocardiopsis alborubida]
MSAVMTLETVEASVPQEVGRLRATYRKRGWTVWHGSATGQYWAAHTGRMVMLSGDTARDLAAEIEKTQPSRPLAAVPAPGAAVAHGAEAAAESRAVCLLDRSGAVASGR